MLCLHQWEGYVLKTVRSFSGWSCLKLALVSMLFCSLSFCTSSQRDLWLQLVQDNYWWDVFPVTPVTYQQQCQRKWVEMFRGSVFTADICLLVSCVFLWWFRVRAPWSLIRRLMWKKTVKYCEKLWKASVGVLDACLFSFGEMWQLIILVSDVGGACCPRSPVARPLGRHVQ